MNTLLFPNNVRTSRVRGALGPFLGSIFGSKMGPAHETSSLFGETKVFIRDISIKRPNHAPTRDVLILSNVSL